MYQLSDKQIDFILNDIRARGVEMESLQNDLLDHICCIIEQNLEANGNFESFYQKTIQTFFKHELWEIEEETISVLTFKNFYVMKKLMIISGAATVVFLFAGITFKFMYWPGASAFLMAGLFLTSFVFLPILYTLKIKEKQLLRDKLNLGLGTLCVILITLHVWFKVMHWPYANNLGIIAITTLLAVFLPVYFFSGLRNPDTKINTIVSSVLIIVACALVLILVRSPRVADIQNSRLTAAFIRSEKLLENENRLNKKLIAHSSYKNINSDITKIYKVCEELKNQILQYETGSKFLTDDKLTKTNFITDSRVQDYFEGNDLAINKLTELNGLLTSYQSSIDGLTNSIINIGTMIDAVNQITEERSVQALNTLMQVQLFVLQQQRDLSEMK